MSDKAPSPAGASGGTIVSIHTCDRAGEPLTSLTEVQALAGQGLQGDRYLLATGTYSRAPGPDREITLLEAEVLEALARELGITLGAAEARRNLVTRGIRLEDLLERTFQVGGVTLRGIRPCDPCRYLERLTGKPLFDALKGRGGLRARILTSGPIRVGDPIRPLAEAPLAAPLPVGAG